MIGTTLTRHPVRRFVVTAGLPLVLCALLTALLVAELRHSVRVQADAAVRGALASAVDDVGAAVRSEIAAARDDKVSPTDTIALADLQRRPGLLAVAVTARDSGRPVLTDSAEPASIVVPIFAADAPSGTTAERRQAIVGYRMVPLMLGSVLARLAPPGGGLQMQGPDRVAAAPAGSMPTSARSFSTPLALTDASGWSVTAWLPDPGIPARAWVGALGVLGLFTGLAAAAVATQRRLNAAVARHERSERHNRLVNGAAHVVQASLDIGEVAPAVSSHFVEELGLAGISLFMTTDLGERPVFSWGAPPDVGMLPNRRIPTQLDPGRTLAVSLTRGGRILGVLRVVAGETLPSGDLQALAIATELLGSTLERIEEFARQQRAVERLRVVDELKSVFLATASHELRTPVTAIVGFSALLYEEWDAIDRAEGRMYLERVLCNGRELQSLVEQLLDFARVEGGAALTDEEILDLGATITEILNARPELGAHHDLSATIAQGCMVRGSRSALERIVTNLVGNAAKYAPTGTRIFVTVRSEGPTVALVVDDEGPGVSIEDREHIFNRFYRGHGTPVVSTRGAGIGLAIVAENAARMAGTSTVGEAPSGGARFVVSLPAIEAGVGGTGTTEVVVDGAAGEHSRIGGSRVSRS